MKLYFLLFFECCKIKHFTYNFAFINYNFLDIPKVTKFQSFEILIFQSSLVCQRIPATFVNHRKLSHKRNFDRHYTYYSNVKIYEYEKK